MPKQRRVKQGCTFLLLLLLSSLLPQPVWAHGAERTLRGSHVVLGPYRLTAWTAPATLRTGEVHIATTLFTADGRLAQNAIVQVTLTGLERQDPPLSALVYPVPGGPIGMGEAAFVVKEAGRYHVAVTVMDETGEQGTMTFTVTIVRVPIFIKGILTALLVFSLLLGLWLLRQGLRVWSRRRPAHESGTVI